MRASKKSATESRLPRIGMASPLSRGYPVPSHFSGGVDSGPHRLHPRVWMFAVCGAPAPDASHRRASRQLPAFQARVGTAIFRLSLSIAADHRVLLARAAARPRRFASTAPSTLSDCARVAILGVDRRGSHVASMSSAGSPSGHAVPRRPACFPIAAAVPFRFIEAAGTALRIPYNAPSTARSSERHAMTDRPRAVPGGPPLRPRASASHVGELDTHVVTRRRATGCPRRRVAGTRPASPHSASPVSGRRRSSSAAHTLRSPQDARGRVRQPLRARAPPSFRDRWSVTCAPAPRSSAGAPARPAGGDSIVLIGS